MTTDNCWGPVPFKMNGEKISHFSTNVFNEYEENQTMNSQFGKNVSFPSTRTVLWNRLNVSDKMTVNILGPERKVQLIINERTLQLAFKQLQVIGKDFNGFLIGDLHCQDEILSIQVDRFDPGRDAEIQCENGVVKVRVPTTTIPGDLSIPTWFHSGMAFVDHETTETHTVEEFIKNMKILDSWCSRKDKLDVKKFVSPKIKCCFQQNDEDILAYITSGCLCVASQFDLTQINTIPIIQTALARNLLGPNPLNELQGNFKTGYVTMDQTRKLLLLLETDPKAFDLPMVGIWLSGLEDIGCAEVWAACIRFIYNRLISERVYAPPKNYLLVFYSQKSSNPQFFEFSESDGKDDVDFNFFSCCDGIQLNQAQKDVDIDGYVFDMIPQTSGLLCNNFKRACEIFTKETTGDGEVNDRKDNIIPVKSFVNLDDSLPHASPSPQPFPQHLQVYKTVPSVPDLSICESFVLHKREDKFNSPNQSKVTVDDKEAQKITINSERIEEKSKAKKSISPLKRDKMLPRQTKASIARMNLNKPEKITHQSTQQPRKKTLAINFSKNQKVHKNNKKTIDVSEETKMKKSPEKQSPDHPNVDTFDTPPLKDEEVDTKIFPRLPVQIRGGHLPSLQPHYIDWRKGENEGSIDFSIDLEINGQSYHPENYSDMQDDESFIVENWLKHSTTKDGTGERKEKDAVNLETSLRVSSSINNSQSPPKDKEKDSNVPSSENNSRSVIHQSNKGTNENIINQNDLFGILESQQKQLAELQAQLKVFMEHQKQSKEEEIESMNTDELLKKELEDQEVLSMQRKQQHQLDELQKQLQLFLKLSMDTREAERKKVDTSVQCTPPITLITPPKTLEPVTIGTNTGESLLWPAIDMTTTNSDTTPRGMIQAGGMELKSTGGNTNTGGCTCCHHCHRPNKNANQKRLESNFPNESLKSNASFHSANLSEINTEDINGSIFNDTASSTRTLASSLKAVDLPVFDDSQESLGYKSHDMSDWNATPLLGESASMLVEQKRKNRKEEAQRRQQQTDQIIENDVSLENNHNHSDITENHEDIMNNKEFYKQMMLQVQEMMTAQNINPSDEEDVVVENLNALPETLGDFQNLLSKKNVMTPEERKEHIRDTTIKKLQEVIKDPELSPPKDMDCRSRSHSTSVLPSYPRINYVSMATDDTFYDNSQHFNEIASKYLPKEYLIAQKKEVKNKTVKFEGVYEWQTGGQMTNTTSVNFSCNMSIASRKYLQKYDLAATEKSVIIHPLGDLNGRYSKKQKDAYKENNKTNKENILDFSKLKNLQKLM